MRRHAQGRKKDLVTSFVISIIGPAIGFIIIQGMVYILIQYGLLQEASEGLHSRRVRTISLLSICLNLIPLQMKSKKRSGPWIRGIVIGTLILALIWIYHFRQSLFIS